MRIPSLPPATAILLRNVSTILLLMVIPVVGTIAVWTISPWNTKARIALTLVFAPYTAFMLYRLFLIFFGLMKVAFFS